MIKFLLIFMLALTLPVQSIAQNVGASYEYIKALTADWYNLIGVMENLLDEKIKPEGVNDDSD